MTGLTSSLRGSRTLTRTLAVGLTLAALLAVGGRLVERSRFGLTDQEGYRRIEAEMRDAVAASTATLGRLTNAIAASPPPVLDPTTSRQLFEQLDRAIAAERSADTGLTVFDRVGQPIAWSGRVSDISRERIDGPAAVFLARGAFGPFLVRVEPLFHPDHPATRIGTVAAEQLLGQPQGSRGAERFVFLGSLAPVTLDTGVTPASGAADEHSFTVPLANGQRAVTAHVDPRDLDAARDRWRSKVRAVVYVTLALTLIACAAWFVGLWRSRRRTGSTFTPLAAVFIAIVVARFLLRAAIASIAGIVAGARPATFYLTIDALVALVVVAVGVDLLQRWRVSRRLRPLRPAGSGTEWFGVLCVGVAGSLGCLALWWYARFLQRITAETTTDLLRFALTPIAVDRLAQAFGLLLLHAAVIWSAALLLRAAVLISRTPRSIPSRLATVLAWAAGVGLGVFLTRGGTQPVPLWPFLLMVFASAGAAVLLGRPGGPVRRMSQAARVFGVYLALLFPALAVYPALHAFAAQAKESLVSGTFGPEAANIREDLQQQLQDAEDSIDARPGLELLLEPIAGAESPTSDQAFAVWSDTVLAARRLTSAVELYDRSGTLVSRFALNLPESATLPPNQGSCRASATPSWDVIEEVSNVLRASRAVCSGSSFAGSVVVRLMLDYRTLPFISSGRPYLESLDATPAASREDAPGRDVEFAVYGWSRSPIYMESTSVWRLPDDVFARMTMSRAPFWATVPRNAQQFRVYFLNDRKGIYALGYPLLTLTDHLINLAELVVLTGVLYVILLAGAGVVRSVTDPKHLSGRTLLREVRASFYRKLFLGFVAVALIPATILALMTRARLVRQFTESVNDSAIKTATVAQRLVEDYAAIEQQRGANALERLDDQVMMLVERAIAQDVNLFDRATLQATSERELFASRVFPTRTPADVYRSIVLDRMLTFAAVEDAGGFSYLLAAAPVRASDSDQIRIVTVPLTLRQRDLDRQRDDLDRRVWSYFVLFVLLGSGLGYWMAERIADPVNRLSRATRRIARGDLEARIAAASSDELGRLVKDFNRMAADLQRQRHELERTQRLEAWADMARQVAHDIKNPLTPIQLSAEHALRVNQDKGRPLSPVLDDCVTAILGQVKLLRQISAEFSSFASSPTARPEPTDLAALVSGVVEPYRTGLATRIAIDAHADNDLPQALVDRTLFARALTNVIENALHAMPGGGRLSIAVSHAPNTPAALQVTVTDTGVGMDPEAVSRIFEPYFSTKASGTGLGLTIAKRNIELVGGSIAVESERGTGTTVAMTVPAAPVIS